MAIKRSNIALVSHLGNCWRTTGRQHLGGEPASSREKVAIYVVPEYSLFHQSPVMLLCRKDKAYAERQNGKAALRKT